MQVSEQVRELVPQVVRWRRHFHQYPERGFEEFETARFIAERLEEFGGFQVRTGVAKTGIVADLRCGAGGPCVMLRADMDALRVQEENEGLEFASQNPGVMHACGHDGHMAMLLGAAKILSSRRDSLSGTVRFIFQPAEEGPGGAAPMIEEGALSDPVPDAAFGIHLWSQIPTGKAGMKSGPMMAETNELRFTVHGKGGHAAAPHEAIDSIVAAAHLITALQTVVSRSVDPGEAAVVSIGFIGGGSVMNAIAERVELGGTMRTFTPEVRDRVLQRVQALVAGLDASFGTETEFQLIERYPALVNDDGMYRVARSVVEEVLGAGSVLEGFTSMGGEDMAFYLRKVPGCFIFLGAGNDEKGCSYPHHSPRFNIDEDALPLGVEILVRLAERFVGPQVR